MDSKQVASKSGREGMEVACGLFEILLENWENSGEGAGIKQIREMSQCQVKVSPALRLWLWMNKIVLFAGTLRSRT